SGGLYPNHPLRLASTGRMIRSGVSRSLASLGMTRESERLPASCFLLPASCFLLPQNGYPIEKKNCPPSLTVPALGISTTLCPFSSVVVTSKEIVRRTRGTP